MTKFRKALFYGTDNSTRVHFQRERGRCLFSFLFKVNFVHGLYR